MRILSIVTDPYSLLAAKNSGKLPAKFAARARLPQNTKKRLTSETWNLELET